MYLYLCIFFNLSKISVYFSTYLRSLSTFSLIYLRIPIHASPLYFPFPSLTLTLPPGLRWHAWGPTQWIFVHTYMHILRNECIFVYLSATYTYIYLYGRYAFISVRMYVCTYNECPLGRPSHYFNKPTDRWKNKDTESRTAHVAHPLRPRYTPTFTRGRQRTRQQPLQSSSKRFRHFMRSVTLQKNVQ